MREAHNTFTNPKTNRNQYSGNGRSSMFFYEGGVGIPWPVRGFKK
jgi:hypothetical protein